MRIAVVGSYGVGLTMRVKQAPSAGQTLSGGVFSSGHGGKGSNQAVAAARLGAEVSFLTAVGPDSFAAQARQMWQDQGVSAQHVITAEAATMVGFIIVEESGENRIVIAPGALDEFAPQHVDAFADEIAAADLLVVSLEIPLVTAKRALEIAREAGVRTLLNPAPAPADPLDAHWWSLIDIVTPNESEAAALTGATDLASPTACAQAIRDRFAGVTVITLGGAGCLVDVPGQPPSQVPPVRPAKVVDTTGAGDAFTAALAVAVAGGAEIGEAVRFASAAGAHAVSIPEVIPSLATRTDIDRLLSSQNT